MKVESICIVGGGSAGWMTAALLSKETDMEICLIESANQKPIGVGESPLLNKSISSPTVIANGLT